jgi:hypothetical protein
LLTLSEGKRDGAFLRGDRESPGASMASGNFSALLHFPALANCAMDIGAFLIEDWVRVVVYFG